MACGCSKNRVTASGGTAVISGTYRVYVKDRKVYETTNEVAAGEVAKRFIDANGNPLSRIVPPGVEA